MMILVYSTVQSVDEGCDQGGKDHERYEHENIDQNVVRRCDGHSPDTLIHEPLLRALKELWQIICECQGLVPARVELHIREAILRC